MLLPLILGCFYAVTAAQQDYTGHVDLFYGTQSGNMFPGVVAAPFAPAKPGPDVLSGKAEAYSGYLPAGNITGFSMMHESGTGGAPKYGVVSQLPVVGSIQNPLVDLSVNRSAPDNATVGYYRSTLSNGVTVELAGSPHAGFFQYTFNTSDQANVLVDVSHLLPSFRGNGWAQGYSSGHITLFPDGHYEGSGTYNNGWNLSPDWTIYFCGHFDQTPTTARTFAGTNVTLSEFGENQSVSGATRVGALFSFNDSIVTSRVGIAWTSAAKACHYVNSEIPTGTQLQALVTASKFVWNSVVFSKVTTTDANETTVGQLYTNLYGMHLLPSNRTGDNPGWESSEPYYDDFFTLWDLFRCTTALYHVIQPQMYEELLRSMIDTWRHEGYMPDARSSNCNGRTQGGSNADNVLADAYVKGVRGLVNWDDAYQAMKADAEIEPPANHDKFAPDSSTQHGRGALPDWLHYSYITPKYTRAVTRAVEYAGNDFGLFQVANGLGYTGDATRYLERSRNWRNHYNRNATSFNVTGFLVPRFANGSFAKQDPMSCDGCYWGDPYYEGKPWEFTMNAHHDLAWLIQQGGGNASFVNRLNILMDPANKIFNAGNEPSFTTPYLYNFVNRQDLSVQQSRMVAKNNYGPGVNGLPGASDAGAMQSWLLWNMIGLYPITGQTTFLIGSPWFANLTIQLQNSKTLTITTTGGNSDSAYYVRSLRVNGMPWNKNWVTWADIFANGGTLDFVLGSNASNWDANGDLPPSPASVKHENGDTGNAAVPKPTMVVPIHPSAASNIKGRDIDLAVGVSCGAALLISGLLYLLLKKLGYISKRAKTGKGDIESNKKDIYDTKASSSQSSLGSAINKPTTSDADANTAVGTLAASPRPESEPGQEPSVNATVQEPESGSIH